MFKNKTRKELKEYIKKIFDDINVYDLFTYHEYIELFMYLFDRDNYPDKFDGILCIIIILLLNLLK